MDGGRVAVGWPRMLWPTSFVLALVVAAYQGFRLPGTWALTFYDVTIVDGTIRRTLVGTVLSPVWGLLDYSFAAYAAVSFAVLVSMVAVLLVALLRARWALQRAVVIVFLLAPTGAYVFHLVGYLEGVVYLLLFVSLALVGRAPTGVAILPVTAAVLVHELALVSAVPVWAWYVLNRTHADQPPWRRLAWLALPAGVGALALLSPRLTPEQVSAVIGRMEETLAFAPRADAVWVYGWGLDETWAVVAPQALWLRLVPIVVTVSGVWIWVYLTGMGPRSGSWRWTAMTIGTCISPAVLSLVGIDYSRWTLLIAANFAIAAYVWLGEWHVEPPIALLLAMVAPLAVTVAVPFHFEDGLSSRGLGGSDSTPGLFDRDLWRVPSNED